MDLADSERPIPGAGPIRSRFHSFFRHLFEFDGPAVGRMTMDVEVISKDPASLSYLALRKAVGIVALALPVALVIGYFVLTPLGSTRTWPNPPLLESISAYYYSCMGHVFTGALCAIALFLLCTQGYDRADEIAGYMACGFAFGVAFCPTTPETASCGGTVTPLEKSLGTAHEILAALLFLTLSYFCLFLFTRTSGNPTPRKKQRNMVYKVCGGIMIFSMAVMTSLHIQAVGEFFQHVKMLLIFETVCLFAFGVAWLTKGETFLKDKEASGGSPAVAGEEKREVTV
jgi:hypothetical protein